MHIEDASLEVRHVPVDAGVRLRVLRWEPEEPEVSWPMVIVSGWSSFLEGWLPLVRGFARRQRTWWVETREKPTARLTGRPKARDFVIPRLAEDLARACAALDDPLDQQVVYASSLGATVALEAMKFGRLPVRGAFLVGPNVHFRYPFWGPAVLRMPRILHAAGLKVVMAYLQRSRVDSDSEPQQWQRYAESMKRAELGRLVASAQAFDGFDLRPDLDRIRTPIAIAHAPTDKLHAAEDWRLVLDTVPGAVDMPMPSDWHTHCADVLPDVDRFVASLS